ncbi:MAG: lipopolysaccharide assembly LapA domain-containing protein [Betaproteobacteria bacterium]
MRVLVWLVRAFIFFTLFAFALNNQQPVTVNWFFGAHWQAPMVIVMLAVFGAGAAIGVLAMLPGAWQRWRRHRRRTAAAAEPAAASAQPTLAPSGFGPEQPPRAGL